MMKQLITCCTLLPLLINISEARRDLNYKYRNECKKNFCLGPDTLKLLKYADLDHIIPFSKGGSNEKDNLMYIPKYLNKVFSDNDYTYLKKYLFNLEGPWDQNDEGRFFNKNHEVYKMNKYFYKSKNRMSSKDRKNILNYLNDILKTKKDIIINNTFGEYLIPIITHRYGKTAIIIGGVAFICYTFIDKNNNGCLDEINENANLAYDYTKKEGSKYAKTFLENANSAYDYTKKEGNKYADSFTDNANSFYDYTKKEGSKYAKIFSENINSFYDYTKKEGSKYTESFSENANSFCDNIKKEGNKYKEAFSDNTNSFYDYTKKEGNKYKEAFSDNINSFYDYTKKESNKYTKTFSRIKKKIWNIALIFILFKFSLKILSFCKKVYNLFMNMIYVILIIIISYNLLSI